MKHLYFITNLVPQGIQLALEHKHGEIGICLIQDAVYLGRRGHHGQRIAHAIQQGIPVYACHKDVVLRGLTQSLHQGVKFVDYESMIDLFLDYDSIINL